MTESKFYWLKLQRDFFKRSDIMVVENMPNGKEYVLFYLKLLLESISHSGELRFTDTIPYNEQMLATVTNTNIDIVRSAMKVFTELNMLEVVEDGTIYMSEVEKMIGSMANNPNANRQRRFRENHSSVTECNAHITESVTENNAIVTECNAHITESVTNNNESKNKSKNKNKSIEIEKETKVKKEMNLFSLLQGDEEISSDPNLLKAFEDFLNMRKAIKKPIHTEEGIHRLVNKTWKLSGGDHHLAIEILRQSIGYEWQDVYALKQDDSIQRPKQTQEKFVNPFTEIKRRQGRI
jgi:predicted phage replisome organizer